MKNANTRALLGMTMGIVVAGTSQAAVVLVGDPAPGKQAADQITVSTTWTANNIYRLQDQIYVKNGATLTIQPGTIIASLPTANGSGSLAITRGSKIMACGTCDQPIIFTSKNDTDTWTGGDPHTGNWRPHANEWGNVTIMGKGLIGDYVTAGNSPSCGNNVAAMEGLIPAALGDPDTLFGGTDDDDNSGCLSYVSLRYGGRVVGLGNELNGLSLGGVGRATEINHIDIMNNVDDGVELWGGTVNLKYINIWNIGDDAFDTDKGWRGKAQFGLIVQGYSEDAAQGGGIGDNNFEMDGAEKADAQPVTTACIYNFTVIGQPVAGDQGIAMRDGARVQFRNCIFMDLGERLIRNDITDGDSGSVGYAFGGTLTFQQTWTTPYTTTSPVNACPNPATTYQAQSAGSAGIGQGFLSELTDSVFFRNLMGCPGSCGQAYNNAAPNEGSDVVGVTAAGGSNPAKGNVVAVYTGAGTPNVNMPIVSLGRHAVELLQGGTQPLVRVISIDPRPANAAVSSMASAPNDGFFTSAAYRGAFGPNENWLCGWTAADAFGFNIAPPGGCPNPCGQAPSCPPDISPAGGDGFVNIDDLLLVINSWNAAGGPADIAPPGGDGIVNIDDLLAIINGWGPCP